MPARRLLLFLPALVSVVVLAACGGGEVIDWQKAEVAVRYEVEEATDTEVTAVECPSGVPVSVGTRFSCLVTAVSGDEAEAELEITSEQGDLRMLGLRAG